MVEVEEIKLVQAYRLTDRACTPGVAMSRRVLSLVSDAVQQRSTSDLMSSVRVLRDSIITHLLSFRLNIGAVLSAVGAHSLVICPPAKSTPGHPQNVQVVLSGLHAVHSSAD